MAALDLPEILASAMAGSALVEFRPTYVEDAAETGPAARRQRLTRALRRWSLSMILTKAQAEAAREFYQGDTAGGVAAFNWTDTVSGVAVEARFASFSLANQAPNAWLAQLVIEEI